MTELDQGQLETGCMDKLKHRCPQCEGRLPVTPRQADEAQDNEEGIYCICPFGPRIRLADYDYDSA